MSIATDYNLIKDTVIKPISSDDFQSPAIRPKYSGLSNEKIKSIANNISFSYQECLEEIINEKSKMD